MAEITQPHTIPNGLTVLGGKVEFKTNTHIVLPSGTSAQRDDNAPDYSLRANTDTGDLEYKRNGIWEPLPIGSEMDNALLMSLILGE